MFLISDGYQHQNQVSILFDTRFRYLTQVSILFDTQFRYFTHVSILFDTQFRYLTQVLIPHSIPKYQYQYRYLRYLTSLVYYNIDNGAMQTMNIDPVAIFQYFKTISHSIYTAHHTLVIRLTCVSDQCRARPNLGKVSHVTRAGSSWY